MTLQGSENFGYLNNQGFLSIKDIIKMVKLRLLHIFQTLQILRWILSLDIQLDASRGKCINKYEKNGETVIVQLSRLTHSI